MKANVPIKSKGTAQVHNARFYTINPRAIVCLAYSKLLKCLALSRDDGSIELWDMNYAPYLEKFIKLTPESQVENMAWASKRLFSVDLTGQLIEWDLNTLQPRNVQSPTGNALWCLDVNSAETELAIGSEEGHINLMSIEHDEINYKLLFRKQEGRVLCCKFDRPGKRLVTGSVGAVRIWNVANGHPLHTITLSAKNVIVYTLQVLKDDTIIAGDSAGYVTVWNAENATQLESNQVLDKHVFALALNEEEDRLVCSGMSPPLIRVLSKTQIKREESVSQRWVKFLQRQVHRHYVKALLVVGDRIISGGQDGLLCISSSTKSRAYTAKYAPYLAGKCVSLAPSANLMLLRYPQCLHLWRLGVPSDHTTEHQVARMAVGRCEQLKLEEGPEMLLQLVVGANKFIQASAISPDSKWICYSTLDELRLSRLQLKPLAVTRLTEDLPVELKPAKFIIFGNDSLWLLHAPTYQMRCFTLKEQQVNFAYSIDLSKEIKSPISLVELSPCGKYLIVASTNHLIAVWQLRGAKSKHLLNLPRYKAGTTALAMHAGRPNLVVAYADGRLVEYDLLQRRFVCETEKHFVPNAQLHSVRGLLLDANNPSIVIVYDEVHLYVLQSCEQEEEQQQELTAPLSKAKRLSKSLESTKLKTYELKMKLNRQHLLQVCRINEQELVTIGVQTKNYLSALPPPYQRKKFGAS
ncbi:hypothetical protein AWZ03_005539 [Drosophila navojoa]|uniref:Uncharacterized protein n=1 Tax=Drosophila navojoa TaxID=7232 RepID=A0A484BIS5_DRONA|nr:U3 small nucleolar RNA-associated protein 4 homolog [Drosophila navojoa]TDG48122.1 hypothetical protein AWZ03_005539 [Drosophila navojoa]